MSQIAASGCRPPLLCVAAAGGGDGSKDGRYL